MTIEEFWNHAFIACLNRKTPAEAAREADESTQICIQRWREPHCRNKWVPNWQHWQNQDISCCQDPQKGDE